MANRTKNILTITAAALMALFLPIIASAQGSYDPWGRDRRDRDWGYNRDRNYDDYYGRNSYRRLRDSASRLKDYAHQLQRDLDHTLDRSDEDGTRHEDRLNAIAQRFRDAASDFRERVGDGRDLNRSSDEARRLLELGGRLERSIEHHFDNYRIRSDWQRVNQELRTIADIYGFGRGGYYGNGGGNWGNNPWGRRYPN
ncbi:MAG: hypothetical protein M3362_26965 [Acidobacteriota bacterium]|nr:hypothetical protein [Acidobacteriota bacterium]